MLLSRIYRDQVNRKGGRRKNPAEISRQYMTTLPASLHRTYLYLEENFREPTGLILKKGALLLTIFEIKTNGGDRAILYSRTKYLGQNQVTSGSTPQYDVHRFNHNTSLLVQVSALLQAVGHPSWALTACHTVPSLLLLLLSLGCGELLTWFDPQGLLTRALGCMDLPDIVVARDRGMRHRPLLCRNCIADPMFSSISFATSLSVMDDPSSSLQIFSVPFLILLSCMLLEASAEISAIA